ncbi:MAG: flagellar hook-associated protein FlgK [Lachnospiraceae bacterium]|nr:flagellar hook-associated protein FlgK [Lachnospiraceae bacterium]
MPLMGSIYVGTSGLQTSNNALNTAAHNLSNIETAGYTRQQILQGSKFYNTIGIASVSNMQVGIGVDYTKCRQVRDEFLDASYRKENGRSSFYEICSESTQEIETLLGEMEGASFKESLAKLWTSVQELQKDPSSSITQGVFIATCSQFLERASAVSKGLNDYQQNLNSRVTGMVEDINTITDQIFELNNKIQKAEIGIEEANDYRDKRNYLIDQLSSKISIKTVENANGGVEIYAEGSPLLIGDTVTHLEVVANEDGFYNVTWGALYDFQPVYNFHQTVSSDFDTDTGELKSLLFARGDHVANYSDLEDYNFYNYGTPDTNDIPIASSIVMNAQGQFDRLIHNMVTAINNVICDNADNSSKTGSYEVFTRLGSARYDAAGDYIKEDTSKSPADVSTMYTISNLKINPDLLKQPTLNSFIKDDKSVDFEKATKLMEVFAGIGQVRDLNQAGEVYVDAAWTINPNLNSKHGYIAFYDSVVGQMANVGSVYNSIVSSQNATVSSLENSRQQVLGVSSEEELQNIIKFQNAYNASSRYINVIDQMLEHIITTL